MPIIAIEGPDKCGKSTLFAALQGEFHAKFVDLPSYGMQRIAIAGQLALRDLECWEALYDPKELWICNRHVLVSDAVYSKLYGRTPLRPSWIENYIRVLYIEVTIDELCKRHRVCNETVQNVDTYGAVLRLYHDVVHRFPHSTITPQNTIADTVACVQALITRG